MSQFKYKEENSLILRKSFPNCTTLIFTIFFNTDIHNMASYLIVQNGLNSILVQNIPRFKLIKEIP